MLISEAFAIPFVVKNVFTFDLWSPLNTNTVSSSSFSFLQQPLQLNSFFMYLRIFLKFKSTGRCCTMVIHFLAFLCWRRKSILAPPPPTSSFSSDSMSLSELKLLNDRPERLEIPGAWDKFSKDSKDSRVIVSFEVNKLLSPSQTNKKPGNKQ